MGNLDSPINLACMFLDRKRKPEYSEETHMDTKRTCRLHTERPWLGFIPSYCEATVLLTAPPCHTFTGKCVLY
uniref:Uncharacterized protein n=1 Tax=Anguilla anguilla TaxID=7936 RepID=A0A0E9QYH5_ANGAN